jgi:hypothetical protein
MSLAQQSLDPNSATTLTSIYGNSRQINEQVYELIGNFAEGFSSESGLVKLDTGEEIDVTSLGGMTVIQTRLKFLEGHKELIDGILVFVKNLENKLDNLLAS